MNRKQVFSGRVIFDHRPKTAGTAVRVWLENTLGTANVLHVTSGKHREIIAMYGGNYPVICSHVKFNRDGERLDPRYQYITCLRDPLDRMVSWLYFALNTIPHDFIGPLGSGTDIKKMVKRVIDSEGDDIPERIVKLHTNIYTRHFSRIITDEDVSSDDAVGRAFAAVRSYDVVGIYDDMPRFLAETAGIMGVRAPGQIERKNTTNKRPGVSRISDKLRNRLTELNGNDYALFERVVNWKNAGDMSSLPARMPSGRATSVYVKHDLQPYRYATSSLDLGTAEMLRGDHFVTGERCEAKVDFCLNRPALGLQLSVRVFDANERLVCALRTAMPMERGGRVKERAYSASLAMKLRVPMGRYKISLLFHERDGDTEVGLLGRYDDVMSFNVLPRGKDLPVPRQPGKVGILVKRFLLRGKKEDEGYARLDMRMAFSAIEAEKKAASDGKGRVRVVSPFSAFSAFGEDRRVIVEVSNDSGEDWVGSSFYPLNLSYHLLNADGEAVIFDGLRTPFPSNGLQAGERIQAEIAVATPVPPGRYKLVPTLVQEKVCWFEDIGLELFPVDIEIKEDTAA